MPPDIFRKLHDHWVERKSNHWPLCVGIQILEFNTRASWQLAPRKMATGPASSATPRPRLNPLEDRTEPISAVRLSRSSPRAIPARHPAALRGRLPIRPGPPFVP